MKDRFDLENEIMHLWSLKDTVDNIIWKQFDASHSLQSQDVLANQLHAVSSMIDLHCDKLMDTFCQVFQLNEYASAEVKAMREAIMKGAEAFPEFPIKKPAAKKTVAKKKAVKKDAKKST
jgi:hypothetical protein